MVLLARPKASAPSVASGSSSPEPASSSDCRLRVAVTTGIAQLLRQELLTTSGETDVDPWRSARTRALAAVLGAKRYQEDVRAGREPVTPPDAEYEYRRVVRWYAKTFHTPIAQVREIPFEELLQDYYESVYEDLEGADPDPHDEQERTPLEVERDLLAEDDAERDARLVREKADREVGDRFLKMVEADEVAKAQKWAKMGDEAPKFKPKSLKRDQLREVEEAAEAVRRQVEQLGKVVGSVPTPVGDPGDDSVVTFPDE